MLYLVRHGRTAANAAGLLQGRLDEPLDELGHQQAAAIAAHVQQISAHGVTRVISSSLVRATATAAYFDRPVEIDDRWLELDYGIYDGTPLGEVPADIWQRWIDDPDFASQDGESFGALDRRVRAAADELVDEFAEHDVVVVSHVSPIKAAVAWSLGVGVEVGFRSHLGHAALCRIGIGRFGPTLHSFNEQP